MTSTTSISLTTAALANIEETGTDVDADIARVRDGLTRDVLLAECLDGADDDRVEGWEDYVSAVCAVAHA